MSEHYPSEHKIKGQRTTRVLLLAILLSACLALVKIITGVLTHSMAILASALDSCLDVGSSVINLIASHEAAKPPDKEHAYGHEKIESLAGLFQSLVIGLSGIYLVFESCRRYFSSAPVEQIEVGLGVMTFSLAVSVILMLRLKHVNKSAQSLILSTESLHYSVDILTNGGVIAALVLVRFTGLIGWDVLVSVLISMYILNQAGSILKRSIDELIDRSLPEEKVQEIKRLILAFNPSIVGLHNFRSRRVGKRVFLDFHIEIRGEEDFKKAHTMTEALIKHVDKRWPGADLTVHYDPEGED